MHFKWNRGKKNLWKQDTVRSAIVFHLQASPFVVEIELDMGVQIAKDVSICIFFPVGRK